MTGVQTCALPIFDFLVVILAIILSAFLSSFSEIIGGIVALFGLLFAIFYILCADGLKGWQSYGKQVMKICVMDATSGKPCTFVKSFIRNILLDLSINLQVLL